MKGYWLILDGAVTDVAAQQEYGRLWQPIEEKYGARLIWNPEGFDSKEKRDTSSVLLVEFPDIATARACYDDPAYVEAKKHAHKASERDLIIMEADFG